MKENVIISICGSQIYDGQEPEVTELVTAGTLLWDDRGCTVAYQESELTGLEGTTTILRMEGGRVTLLREGNVNSQMNFEEGEKHLSMYETPYGALAVGIDTDRILNTLGESGGELEIRYAIEIDNMLAGRSVFRMTVKKNPEN